jgi:hypothetical protein
MSKKMGRPKLPKSEARSIMLSTRVNADEYRSINAAIFKSGKDKTIWIRESLLNATNPV